MTWSNTTFSVFSFIGFFFCAIPFTWHLKHRNTGTCLLMAWGGLSCLYQCVNSIVWNGNIVNWSPVWCDICTRIYLGSGVGLPASTLCIFRRLHSISTAQGTMPTDDKSVTRRRVMIDLALGLGLPVLEMILGMMHFLQKREILPIYRIAYISQGHRYNIFEDIGCTTADYNTVVGIIFVNVPPVLIGLVTACYATLTIRAFNRRRIEFNDVLAQHSNISSGLYLRLMCFGCLEILWVVPISSYYLYVNISGGIQPWISWNNVHTDFSHVLFIPRSIWQGDPEWSVVKSTTELGRWLGVVCAFNFFILFGFAEEARMNYRAAYLTVAKYMGLSTASSNPSGSHQPKGKRNDIEALVFAHTATTNLSIPIPDVEEHAVDKTEDGMVQVNTTFANDSLNADVNNFHLDPIPPALPEPAITKS